MSALSVSGLWLGCKTGEASRFLQKLAGSHDGITWPGAVIKPWDRWCQRIEPAHQPSVSPCLIRIRRLHSSFSWSLPARPLSFSLTPTQLFYQLISPSLPIFFFFFLSLTHLFIALSVLFQSAFLPLSPCSLFLAPSDLPGKVESPPAFWKSARLIRPGYFLTFPAWFLHGPIILCPDLNCFTLSPILGLAWLVHEHAANKTSSLLKSLDCGDLLSRFLVYMHHRLCIWLPMIPSGFFFFFFVFSCD